MQRPEFRLQCRNPAKIGETMGNFTVVSDTEYRLNKKGQYTSYVKCQCKCGKIKEYTLGYFRTGAWITCGCNKKGHSNTRLYRTWQSMKRRCLYAKHKAYPSYGGRGITIFEDWLNFENFKKWAEENGYKENLSIDRIDSDNGYYPENCRWVTVSDNSKNVAVCRKNKELKLLNRILELENENIKLKDIINKNNILLV